MITLRSAGGGGAGGSTRVVGAGAAEAHAARPRSHRTMTRFDMRPSEPRPGGTRVTTSRRFEISEDHPAATRGAAAARAPSATTDGAPATNQIAIAASNIRQP